MGFNRQSIQEIMHYIKRFLVDDTFFYSLIIGLVALIAYGLGQHTAVSTSANTTDSEASAITVVEEAPRETQPEPTSASSSAEMQLVGSKNGTKYHFLTCPGANQIKEENKVFFDSFASARAAGYEPAANCAGLE